ncbi:RHS repeat-associated core domain-containing protein [Paenibacillus assamensis]|uniref:RHS repeat-associated core domain-containing protein n=1 Tax=Paenibacillus assamensis TaxID=311244 RepID=UPI00048B1FE3|nr:RHS repeat-associated core domain-containing protein [Paenibacillus assamensis]
MYSRKRFKSFQSFVVSILVFALLVTAVPIGYASPSTGSEQAAPNSLKKDQEQQSKEQDLLKEEVVDLRTEDSRTFSNGDGTLTTEISQVPIHYKDESSDKWLPIDNKLHTNGQFVYNNANDYKVKFSKKNKTNANLFELTEDQYGITLYPAGRKHENKSSRKKRDTSSNQAALDAPQEVTSSHEKNNIEYPDVYPDVNIKYTLASNRIKEDIILEKMPDPTTPTVYSFSIDLKNLDYRAEPNGTISLLDKQTQDIVYFIDKPFMYDSYRPEGYKSNPQVDTYPEEALSFDVEMRMQEEGDQLTLDIVPNRAWLEDSSRVYPVTIDPTIVKYQPKAKLNDTNIRSASPTATAPTETTLGVGLYKDSTKSNVIRSLLHFDTSNIKKGSQVLTAEINMRLASVSNDTDISATMHVIEKTWSETGASWNNANVNDPWKVKGGDFAAAQTSTVSGIGSLTTLDIIYQWPIAPYIVDRWINDPSRNRGLIFKSHSETTNTYKKFVSGDDTAFAEYSPVLAITYYPASRLGMEPYWTYGSLPVGDGVSSANLGTGNHVLSFTDFVLDGRGNFGFSLNRTYNSKSGEHSPFGYGWSFNGSESIIEAPRAGEILYTDSDATSHTFKYSKETNRFEAPPGTYVTLKKRYDEKGFTIGYDIVDKTGNVARFDRLPSDEEVSIIRARISSEFDRHGNTITYGYDVAGKLAQITDPSGRQLILNHNDKGKVISSMLEGKKFEYGYDASSKLIYVDEHMDASKISRTQFEYDNGNRIKAVIDPNGRRTDFTYDENNSLLKIQEPSVDASGADSPNRPGTNYDYQLDKGIAVITDPLGNATTYHMNSNYVVTKVIDADGNTFTTVVDENFNPTDSTDAKNGLLKRTYDNKGNVLTVKDEEGNLTTYLYDNFSNVTSETDAKNNKTIYEYNNVGDLMVVIDPKQERTTYTYDQYGNRKTATLSNGTVETFDYDDKGNYVKSVKDASGNVVTSYTDKFGNVTRLVDGEQHETNYTYNKRNQLTSVLDAMRNTTLYEYNDAGDMTKFINANGHVTTYTYNGLGLVTSSTNSLGQTTHLEYDANGNLKKSITPNGDTLTTHYNKLNQVTDTFVNGKVNWSYLYDANGNVEKVLHNGNQIKQYQYYKNDTLKLITDRGNNISYIYDPNQQVKELAYRVGAIRNTQKYAYNALNQLTEISKNDVKQINYKYNKLDNLEHINRVNGTSTSLTYDKGNQLLTHNNIGSNGQMMDTASYSYDKNGNVSSIDTETGTIKYEYDGLEQLVKEVLSDGTTIAYSYDKVGNRIEKTITNKNETKTIRYSHNNANQVASIDGVAYTYDKNGNLTFDGKHSYRYNEQDQLVQITDINGDVTFQAEYDETGKRIRIVTPEGTTNFFYDGDDILYETNANNELTVQYTWDDSGNPITMSKDGETYYYHLNGHADVTAMTDSKGNVVASYAYDAWGNITEQSGPLAEDNPYRYAGYRYDEHTGLYYLLARYYNPAHSHFLTLDPHSGSSEIPLTKNGYTYANNNPINLVDPDGEWVVLAIKIIFKVAPKVIKYAKKASKKITKSKDHGYLQTFSSKANSSYKKEKVTRKTKQITEHRRNISAKNLEKEKRKFLGNNYVNVAPGKWRNSSGSRQFRAKPNDIKGGHGNIGPHVHFEFLNKNVEVTKNVHIRLR